MNLAKAELSLTPQIQFLPLTRKARRPEYRSSHYRMMLPHWLHRCLLHERSPANLLKNLKREHEDLIKSKALTAMDRSRYHELRIAIGILVFLGYDDLHSLWNSTNSAEIYELATGAELLKDFRELSPIIDDQLNLICLTFGKRIQDHSTKNWTLERWLKFINPIIEGSLGLKLVIHHRKQIQINNNYKDINYYTLKNTITHGPEYFRVQLKFDPVDQPDFDPDPDENSTDIINSLSEFG